MPVGRVAICGLYLSFASLRSCIERVKSLGVHASDVSIALPDGSIMCAMPIATDLQKLEAVIRRSRAFDRRSGEPICCVKISTGLNKTLLTLGVPVYDSERFESKIRNGGILVSIRCTAFSAEQVREVLMQTGAEDISLNSDHKTEQRSALKKEAYSPAPTNGWQQRSAHA